MIYNQMINRPHAEPFRHWTIDENGILREMTGRQRRRLFVYGCYIDIVSRGTEPLPQ